MHPRDLLRRAAPERASGAVHKYAPAVVRVFFHRAQRVERARDRLEAREEAGLGVDRREPRLRRRVLEVVGERARESAASSARGAPPPGVSAASRASAALLKSAIVPSMSTSTVIFRRQNMSPRRHPRVASSTSARQFHLVVRVSRAPSRDGSKVTRLVPARYAERRRRGPPRRRLGRGRGGGVRAHDRRGGRARVRRRAARFDRRCFRASSSSIGMPPYQRRVMLACGAIKAVITFGTYLPLFTAASYAPAEDCGDPLDELDAAGARIGRVSGGCAAIDEWRLAAVTSAYFVGCLAGAAQRRAARRRGRAAARRAVGRARKLCDFVRLGPRAVARRVRGRARGRGRRVHRDAHRRVHARRRVAPRGAQRGRARARARARARDVSGVGGGLLSRRRRPRRRARAALGDTTLSLPAALISPARAGRRRLLLRLERRGRAGARGPRVGVRRSPVPQCGARAGRARRSTSRSRPSAHLPLAAGTGWRSLTLAAAVASLAPALVAWRLLPDAALAARAGRRRTFPLHREPSLSDEAPGCARRAARARGGRAARRARAQKIRGRARARAATAPRARPAVGGFTPYRSVDSRVVGERIEGCEGADDAAGARDDGGARADDERLARRRASCKRARTSARSRRAAAAAAPSRRRARRSPPPPPARLGAAEFKAAAAGAAARARPRPRCGARCARRRRGR